MFVPKRQPHAKQQEAFGLSKDKTAFALLMRPGTGKSKVAIDTALHLYTKGRINALVIIAPKGIHTKWVKDDFPADVPEYIDYKIATWRSGNKQAIADCTNLIEPGTHLRILSMNIEALSKDKSPAEDLLTKFLNCHDALLVIDESDTIKNPDAKRTKRLLKLGNKASYKRILTGTPVANSVFDLYSQFSFLDTHIFGQSYFSFKHQYAEILPETHPTVMAIRARGARFVPAIVAKDLSGKPIYKNLDKLKEVIGPYSFTCTLEECHDLPPKIYETIYYELDSQQRRIYEDLKKKAQATVNDDTVTVLHKMTLMLRLQQILSGYLPGDTEEILPLFKKPEDNPRLSTLLTLLDTLGDEQVIIWCRFRKEIEEISTLLGDKCVTYYGETKDREHQLEKFQYGYAQYLVGNPPTGGVGLNLTNSHIMVYYSNDFSYRNRDQSESRQYRIGQTQNTVIYDICAENTIDEHIIKVLHNKEDVALEILALNTV